jgi:23S rRNA (cytidine1920-2'-O)/16S rRNA (cytidine1409-2'-O)-methyltransferase
MQERQRLDVVLVARGLTPTRARARDLIGRGLVTVAGALAVKAGQLVAADADITVVAEEAARVSRGGVKLEAAFAAFAVPVAGRTALDLGASTGGFTEVLLAAGARHVTAVDVGHGQLHPRLAADARVFSLEGRDARTLTAVDLPEPPGIITADLSFISLEKALAAALALSSVDAWAIVLVKPQFELGRDALGKGGIVRADVRAEDAVDRVAAWLAGRPEGWSVQGTIPSPLTGGDGNREFLLAAQRAGRA